MNTHRETYQAPHCYQYDIRLKNLETDLNEAALTKEEMKQLRVTDFEFQFVPKEEKEHCQEIKAFVERHEWLGKMPHRPTHRFIATYRGRLAGVVVMATPNSFSQLLGPDGRDLEKLIARGACISWSPQNLASALVMFSIRWMVKHTSFRVFTAYSDTDARELGTIYQACNFTYLGNGFGARVECFDPMQPERGWFSDRLFRKAAQYRRYADRLGYTWRSEWGDSHRIHWSAIPELIRHQLKAEAKNAQARCERREVPKKHKYAYILGRTQAETKRLREKFRALHPEMAALPYPKTRGPKPGIPSVAIPCESPRPTNFAATENAKIPAGPLREVPFERRPHGHEESEKKTEAVKFKGIREIARIYGISDWTLYRFIKTDPSFPYLNVGLKKKFVINEESFRNWMEERTKNQRNRIFHLPTGEELLKRRSA